MAVTPLPFLDRTAATFKTDVDAFFAQKLPQFSVEVNQVATDAQTSATAANTSKNAAATSATNAKTSETNAANSASAANTSKTNAATSETNAASSATAANSSKTAAANSATAAATSATNSEASAVRAKNAADSIASGPVTSVNGKTGAPVLNKSDIGLSLADNVSVIAAGIGTPQLAFIADIDSVTLSNGWYGVNADTVGVKPNNLVYGTLLVSGYYLAANQYTRVSQTFYIVDGTEYRTWGRKNSAGTWSAWKETSLPTLTGSQRKPLTPNADATAPQWGDTLSIPKYLDRLSRPATVSASFILDMTVASVFDLTLSANTTLSVSNLPSMTDECLTVVVRIRQSTTAYAISWFSGITWLTPGNVAPVTPRASQIIEYIFSTTGVAGSWFGRVGAAT